MTDLPYIDLILEGRRRGDPSVRPFVRFVHWGYWPDPKKARRDEADLAAAVERLNEQILADADIKAGLNVLDVGCGFGGTLDSINKRRQGMQLVGLNNDRRQLDIAMRELKPGYDNTIQFVQGDACALPFPGQSFDRVLAIECIFHFQSRLRFLKEGARALKLGGLLVISDFVLRFESGVADWGWLRRAIGQGYGELGAGWENGSYQAMAREAGLETVSDRDITRHTLPTYPILLDLLRRNPQPQARKMIWPTRLLAWASRLGALQYRIVSFRKPRL